MSERAPAPIIGLLCCWCAYAGADLAGQMRLACPPEMRVIQVPCSGSVSMALVLKLLLSGARGVILAGCHKGDCHYRTGNLLSAKRALVIADTLSAFGLSPQRFRVEWVSAAEGEKWARVAGEFVDEIRGLDGG